jgi:transcription factor MBP1
VIGEDSAYRIEPVPAPSRAHDDYDNISAQLNDDDSIADDTTVASASFMLEDDRYDMSQQSTGHRKRKREELVISEHERLHRWYADELLDYFMVSQREPHPPKRPDPPLNFDADWLIDNEGHTAMHWAAAMGDVEVMKELSKFGCSLTIQNVRGETPLMRVVLFTNCMDKQTMPFVVKELISTIDCVDFFRSTVLHHAAAVTTSRGKHHFGRYYLDVLLNKMLESLEPDNIQRILDAQDIEGNTAIHIAAKNKARKCVRALMGRGARTDIPNQEGVTAEDLIQELNESRRMDRHPQASSSPYGPDHRSLYEMPEEPRRNTTHISEASMSIESTIKPLMLEKFQDLARSFDEELVEKETSEKEARRILQSTHQELAAMNTQILEISCHQESPETAAQGNQQLEQIEKMVTSLIEQQQKLNLWGKIQREEAKMNGHMMTSDDDIAERAMLAQRLITEQNKRQKLAVQYRDALSDAGAGERGELYRRLIRKALGTDIEMMDDNMDNLIEQLKEDQRGREGETIIPDDI